MNDQKAAMLERLEVLTGMSGHVLKAMAAMDHSMGIHLANATIDGVLDQAAIPRLLSTAPLKRKVSGIIDGNQVGEFLALHLTTKTGQGILIVNFFNGLEQDLFLFGEAERISTPIVTNTKILLFYSYFYCRPRSDRKWRIRIIDKNPQIETEEIEATAPSFKEAWSIFFRQDQKGLMKNICKEGGNHFLDWIDNYKENEDMIGRYWQAPDEKGNFQMMILGKPYHVTVKNSNLYLVRD